MIYVIEWGTFSYDDLKNSIFGRIFQKCKYSLRVAHRHDNFICMNVFKSLCRNINFTVIDNITI